MNNYIHSVIATIFVLLVIFLFNFTMINVDLFDPISLVLSDFDFYDLAFSQMATDQQADTNIVIVNIGNIPRNQIARMINIINLYDPQVIGIDAFFRERKADSLDFPLSIALSNVKNLILVSELTNYNSKKEFFQQINYSNQLFNIHAETGFANFPYEPEKGFRTIRTFYTNHSTSKLTEQSFPLKLIEKYDSIAFLKARQRTNKIESINFIGNLDKFITLDTEDIFSFNFSSWVFKGKIVLIGFFERNVDRQVFEDVFFTPMNKRPIGKTYPDMYGIVIHANIISMLLGDRYIEHCPKVINIIIVIIILGFNVFFCFITWRLLPKYYDFITKVFSLLVSIALTFGAIVVFHYFSIKVDLTLLLISIVLSSDLVEFYRNLFYNSVQKVINNLFGV